MSNLEGPYTGDTIDIKLSPSPAVAETVALKPPKKEFEKIEDALDDASWIDPSVKMVPYEVDMAYFEGEYERYIAGIGDRLWSNADTLIHPGPIDDDPNAEKWRALYSRLIAEGAKAVFTQDQPLEGMPSFLANLPSILPNSDAVEALFRNFRWKHSLKSALAENLEKDIQNRAVALQQTLPLELREAYNRLRSIFGFLPAHLPAEIQRAEVRNPRRVKTIQSEGDWLASLLMIEELYGGHIRFGAEYNPLITALQDVQYNANRVPFDRKRAKLPPDMKTPREATKQMVDMALEKSFAGAVASKDIQLDSNETLMYPETTKKLILYFPQLAAHEKDIDQAIRIILPKIVEQGKGNLIPVMRNRLRVNMGKMALNNT